MTNQINHHSYLTEYKSHLISNNYSQKTIQSYTSELSHYFSIYSILSRDNILSYTKQISHLAASSYNHHLSSIKSFNEYLLDHKIVDSIYIIHRDFVKQQKNLNPTNITNTQVEKLLNKVDKDKAVYKSRNIAIMNLISDTGIRREEVTNIELKDIDIETGELIVCHGKGNKERIVPLSDNAISALVNYLKDRVNHKFSSSSYLFLTERSPKMTTQSINDIFDKYKTKQNKIYPHQLRHAFASTTQEKRIVSLQELQYLLGHADIRTTCIYSHPRKCDIKNKLKGFSMRGSA
jgi:site-specific recombinase XerD